MRRSGLGAAKLAGLRSRAEPGFSVRGRRGRPSQARFLKRQLSLPVSMMSQWWVSRSSMAVVIFASPNTCGQSAKARLVVITIEVVEEQLPARLAEGQVAEFVNDHEVVPLQRLGQPAPASRRLLLLELVD